jgi:hypothetical protein
MVNVLQQMILVARGMDSGGSGLPKCRVNFTRAEFDPKVGYPYSESCEKCPNKKFGTRNGPGRPLENESAAL